MHKKNQIWISMLIYTSITIITIMLILQVGIPLVNKLKHKTLFENIKTNMNQFDNYIQQVVSEGPGSQRVFPLEIKEGELKIENSSIIWEIDNNDILDPRTTLSLGNLKIAEGDNVKLTINRKNYTIENSILKVVLIRIPETNKTWINTSDIIKMIELKTTNTIINGNFEFSIANDSNSMKGFAYTEISPNKNSTSLNEVKYTIHMNTTDSNPTTCDYIYDLNIELDSNSDFINVYLDNQEVNC